MEIPVSNILQAPQSVTRREFSERIELPSGEERLLEPVSGDLIITRASSKILQVEGAFHTRLGLQCDRCGNDFELPVDFTLNETLEVVEGPITSEEVEEAVEQHGILDATDLIRQGLLLSLPPRRLCGCEPKSQSQEDSKLDPRWAALKALQDNSNGKD